MHRIRDVFARVLLVLVIAVCLFLIAVSWLPRVFGYVPCGIEDNSMPVYPAGTLIFAQRVDWNSVSAGDVLVFEAPKGGGCFTRYAVELWAESQQIVTASAPDAEPDPMTTAFRCVVGRVAYSVPYFGYPVVWIHTFWGKAVLVLLYSIWIAVLIELHRVSKSKRRETPT